MQLDVAVTQIAGFVIFCLRAEKQDLPRHWKLPLQWVLTRSS